MDNGKNICKELKAIRRNIADENGIALDIEECHYEGDCSGTCPRCEQELRQLEDELARRLRLGKVATVGGLAVGLAASASAAQLPDTQLPEPTTGMTQTVPAAPPMLLRNKPGKDSVMVHGLVLDKLTGEPIPFVNIVFMQQGQVVTGGQCDYEGKFAIMVPKGKFEMKCSFLGYGTETITIDTRETKGRKKGRKKGLQLDPILMEMNCKLQGEVPVIMGIVPANIGPDAPTQEMEREGVKVIVQ